MPSKILALQLLVLLINFSNLSLDNRFPALRDGQASNRNYPSPPCAKPRMLPTILEMRKIIFISSFIILFSCGQRNSNTTKSETQLITLDTLIADNYQLTFNYSDSFPLTDIYGDLKYRINLTDTIGNWHDRAVKIQSYLADRFHDYFYTTDSTLVLTLADGKESIFAKWDSVNAEGYTFEHYFDKIDYYLLRVQWDEGNCWMLVNRKNGFKKYISGLPYISVDNKQILTINTDLEAGYSFNGIELYSLNADSIKVEFSKETVFGPISVKWISENQFLLRREYFYVDTITGNQDNIIDFKKVTIEKKNSQ